MNGNVMAMAAFDLDSYFASSFARSSPLANILAQLEKAARASLMLVLCDLGILQLNESPISLFRSTPRARI